MNANVDLRQLAVRRDGPTPPSPRRRSHLLTRYLLPAAVLLGFTAVAGWSVRDTLLPARPVTVVPVLTTRAEVCASGTPLFQSAGWVEPRPTPVLVTALTEGVIDRLLVVEGQEVKAGEPVARLIDADARLALRAAEADAKLRKAELASARAALAAARTNAAQPLQLQSALAEAEAMLAQKETERAALPAQLKAAEARLAFARAGNETRKRAAGATAELDLREAESAHEVASAVAEELRVRKDRVGREVDALAQRRDALRKRLELKVEETRQLADAEAALDAAEARAEQAAVAVDVARLRLERLTVRAPIDGRVLALIARPGTRLMGLTPDSMHDASNVVSLYDPTRLQVRADVRLEDVPRVQPGQAVKIETPAAPGGAIDGEVLCPTSLADIQKNTLQVKVAVKAPPPTLRPDMLVQVTFLAAPAPQAAEAPSASLRLLAPRALVESGDGEAHVWVADRLARVARRRPVKLGQAAGELVEVVDGLNPGDRLISGGREGLRDGQRIDVTGEDAPPAGAPGRAAGGKPARLPQGGHEPGQ
jgi:RND family efflux transporter MFP subunit